MKLFILERVSKKQTYINAFKNYNPSSDEDKLKKQCKSIKGFITGRQQKGT